MGSSRASIGLSSKDLDIRVWIEAVERAMYVTKVVYSVYNIATLRRTVSSTIDDHFSLC